MAAKKKRLGSLGKDADGSQMRKQASAIFKNTFPPIKKPKNIHL
jgi:type II secretory pathway component PulL